ncbi:hypothetical protein AB1K62_14470 [Parasphingorhabdus sp. JC815]|uniref:hypothetical protein n=1 Tax=Parasphingorhabdus sp. JC815 TaxID=3232140 RepID=UPI00345811FD
MIWPFNRSTKPKAPPRRPDGRFTTRRVSKALVLARELNDERLVKRLEALL